jgi:hypothetical protein
VTKLRNFALVVMPVPNLGMGGATARWAKNKFSPVSIKISEQFEKNNQKGTFWPFSSLNSGLWPFFSRFQPL